MTVPLSVNDVIILQRKGNEPIVTYRCSLKVMYFIGKCNYTTSIYIKKYTSLKKLEESPVQTVLTSSKTKTAIFRLGLRKAWVLTS